jgi:hypothetical protein
MISNWQRFPSDIYDCSIKIHGIKIEGRHTESNIFSSREDDYGALRAICKLTISEPFGQQQVYHTYPHELFIV